MIGLLLIPAFIIATVFAHAADAETASLPVDVSAVRTVSVSGDASSIRITTSGDKAYSAMALSRRDGWFSKWYSSWFFNDCPDTVRMEVRDATLFVDVAQSSWMDLSDCVLEINANVPSGSSVRIAQHALQAKLSGDFETVAITGNAADISLAGHASTVSVSGNAVRAHLAYDTIRQDEKIDIDSNSLDADLDFGHDVPVAYTVVAKASFVDAAPSVPGAKPAVSIKGDYVRATIR